MDRENNDLERLYAESFHAIESGTLLTGTVVTVKQDGVIVDIGYKSEGFIRIDEFSEEELSTLRPGAKIEVFVVAIKDADGIVYLSKERASRIRSWNRIEKAVQEGADVKGTITEKTKGGLLVDIGGVRAFLPGSQIDTRVVRDVESLIGQTLTFRILKVNSRRSNVIVSRRAIIEEERAHLKSETLKNLADGALMTGTVKNITDYGVFVDLGGIDGLLHISDISWGRISHPRELFKVGDSIEVVILKYNEETERVTLGYKQKHPDPWLSIEEKYQAGSTVTGSVVSITDYGAFVEVEEGLEGLVHMSEIDWTPRPKHPSKYLSVGDAITAVVLKADRDERKLSLSIRRTKPSPWELIGKNYQTGQRISGKVKSITDFGAFVGLPEGVDGLIHISDMSWTRHIKHPSELLRKGQVVETVILSIDAANEKISLGLKQLQPDPWIELIPSKFHLGNEISGTILRTTDFGIFLEMEDGVEGLIYANEIVPRPEDNGAYREGEQVRARIIKIDLDERKIGLSMKHLRNTQ